MSGGRHGHGAQSMVDDEDHQADPGTTFKEFDCPGCSANNPTHEPFGDGAELLCNYCGSEYKVTVADSGKLKFREL